METAGLVAAGQQQAGLVLALAAGSGVLLADDEEAGGVAGLVLDALGKHLESVDLGGLQTRDGCGVLFGRSRACGLGVAADGDALGVREMAVEPAAALRQGLLMRIDRADGAEILGHAHQVMVDPQTHLAGDHERRGHEHVQGVTDHALGGILDRDDTEIAGTRFDLAEDLPDGRQGEGLHRMAEVLDRRGLSEGPGRAEIGDVERALERQTGGHDLAKEPRDLFAVERTRIGCLDATQNRDLALRPVELHLVAVGCRLDMSDLLGAAGTLADQTEQL